MTLEMDYTLLESTVIPKQASWTNFSSTGDFILTVDEIIFKIICDGTDQEDVKYAKAVMLESIHLITYNLGVNGTMKMSSSPTGLWLILQQLEEGLVYRR